MDDTAIVIADSTGTIHFWSKGAESAFGYRAKDAVAHSLDLIVPHEFREAHWKGFRRAIASGSAMVEGQPTLFPVLKADGRTEYFSGTLTLLRGGERGIIGCMVVFAEA